MSKNQEVQEKGGSVADWEPFPKIARMNRDCIITEKLDGTNGAIRVAEDGSIRVFSKNQELVDTDSHGFKAWVFERAAEIRELLGPGLHRGEFVGLGINKNRHKLSDKRFALYATERWGSVPRPRGFDVVPLLYKGLFDTARVNGLARLLDAGGSRYGGEAEGVVVFHLAGSFGMKVTCRKDGEWKGRGA